MRANRFRHQLINWTFIQSPTFSELEDALRHFHAQQIAEKLSAAEWTAIYILIFGLFHRPHDFIGGVHGEHFPIGDAHLTTTEFLKYFGETKWTRHFPQDKKLLEFFCARSFRSLPIAVNRAVAAWSRQEYPLDLREDVPSVDEVLDMQTRGRRCVSVLMKPAELRSFIDGRDALSFAVHDLLHADHFFRDPVHARAQMEFLRRLHRCSSHEFIVRARQTDPQFRFDWEYLIADMNTVPLHLFKTWKAFLLKAVKRSFGTEPTRPLNQTGEDFFSGLLAHIADAFELNADERAAWMALNTADFRFPEQAILLTNAVQK